MNTAQCGRSLFLIAFKLQDYCSPGAIWEEEWDPSLQKDGQDHERYHETGWIWKGVRKEAKEYTFPVNDHMAGWKSTVFNRKYIFNWCIFHCYVSLPEGTLPETNILNLNRFFPLQKGDSYWKPSLVGGRTVSFGECKGTRVFVFFFLPVLLVDFWDLYQKTITYTPSLIKISCQEEASEKVEPGWRSSASPEEMVKRQEAAQERAKDTWAMKKGPLVGWVI